MFIESKKPNDSINVLEFRLYSADAKYRCHIQPEPSGYEPYGGVIKFNETNAACIAFRDSRELDQLIKILQDFRDGCYGIVGEWRKEN